MRLFVLSLLVASTLSASQAKQTFTGVITDSLCAKGDHSGMRMGSNDAECTEACVSAHDAAYVLYDGKDVYALSDQQMPVKFAGQHVRVVGSLDGKTKTIRVESIAAAR